MRITLICATLGAGGAERVMTLMANYWAESGHDVAMATFEAHTQSHYPLRSRVKLVPTSLNSASPTIFHSILNNVRRIGKLRRAIVETRPDVVISFIETANVRVLASLFGTGIPIIVSERSNPAVYKPGKVWEALRLMLYPVASRVVVQSSRAKDYFPRRIRSLCRVIPNPVLIPEGFRRRNTIRRDGPKRIIALGRLSEEKCYDLLIRTFGRIQARHPEWTLEIVGDGPLRQTLVQLRDELRLQGRVELSGLSKAPFEKLGQADMFVLTSRFEGFPNALCEAMAAGLPVVSFDCPNGPREIIRDGVDGILVPHQDAEALANAMERVMGDSELQEWLASRAPEILDRFGIDRVMRMWEDTIAEVASVSVQFQRTQETH